MKIDEPKVTKLPRKVAQELVLLAILSPLMVSDLSAELSSAVYATDASDAKGTFVCALMFDKMLRVLCGGLGGSVEAMSGCRPGRRLHG